MHRQFGPNEAKRFYDRFGSLQDARVYERTTLKCLVTASDFECAAAVFELGCGTGRLGAQLLEGYLPEAARYVGVDISSTEGAGPISRLVSAAWMRLYKINPSLVGGCRALMWRSRRRLGAAARRFT